MADDTTLGVVCACAAHPGMHLADAVCVALAQPPAELVAVAETVPDVSRTCLDAMLCSVLADEETWAVREKWIRNVLIQAGVPPQAPAQEWEEALLRAQTLLKLSPQEIST